MGHATRSSPLLPPLGHDGGRDGARRARLPRPLAGRHERRHLHRPAARRTSGRTSRATCATATASTCRARTWSASGWSRTTCAGRRPRPRCAPGGLGGRAWRARYLERGGPCTASCRAGYPSTCACSARGARPLRRDRVAGPRHARPASGARPAGPRADRGRRRPARRAWTGMTLEEAHRHCRDVARGRGAQLLLRLHAPAAREAGRDLRGVRVQPPRRRQRERRRPRSTRGGGRRGPARPAGRGGGRGPVPRTTRCWSRWPTRSAASRSRARTWTPCSTGSRWT